MKQKPVVMQILPALSSGGVERGTIEIAKALKDAGWHSIVVSSGGVMTYDLKKIGVKHITLPVHSKNPLTMMACVKALRQIIKDEKVGIVHARSRIPAWIAKIALRKMKGVRFLTTFHGAYGTKPAWIKKFYNRVMVSGDLVISISHFITRHILDNYGISASKIRLIYRGADVDKFDPLKVNTQREQDLAEKWQVPVDKPVLLLPGRLTRPKGHLVVLEALAKMHNKAVTCIFLGSDQGRVDYHKELEEKINKLGLDTTVLIRDHCSDMPVAYKLADIVISASLYPEAFGRVIPEAQAMGKLVVGTNHGGAMETIQEGLTGFLVPVGDANALAKKLDYMLDMPMGDKKRMSIASMASVRKYFSMENMCAKTLKVYEELAEKENDEKA